MEKIELPEGFGIANYDATVQKTNEKSYIVTNNLKKGANRFRPMPPMKSQSSTGKWSQYMAVHFGYKTPNPNKPDSFLWHPFYCPAQSKGFKQASNVVCAECERTREYQETIDRFKKALPIGYGDKKNENKRWNEEEKKAIEHYKKVSAPFVNWLNSHWLDKKHYINVMLPDRTFQVLKVAHRTKKMIDDKFKVLKEKNKIDPTAINQGVWVNVEQPQVISDVPVVEIQRDENDRIELVPLTVEECNKALEECMDLIEDRLKIARELTVEQVDLLCKSSGDPEEIIAILEGDPKNLKGLKEQYSKNGSKSIYELTEKELKMQMESDDNLPF